MLTDSRRIPATNRTSCGAIHKEDPIDRTVYMARLKADKVEGYKKAHETVWPQLIKEATLSGIRNHGCFFRSQDLIIYLETDSYQRTLADFNAKQAVMRWNTYMSEFFDPLFPAQAMEPWEEVFHMD